LAQENELADTGERMVPEFHAGKLIYAEHLIRYTVAQEIVRGKVVLDVASGSGYGAALLSEKAAHVYGFDADASAVAYAQAHYGSPKISFAVADAIALPLEDDSVDVVTTFETIEHIADFEAFMAEIKRVLKPGGLAIISTPNDLEFAEGNHFHLHEFVKDELLALVKRYFRYVEEYYQATWKYVAIDTMAAMKSDGPLVRPIVNSSPLKEEESLYFYFLCSNEKITDSIEPISAIGEHYSERALVQQAVLDQAVRDALQGELDSIRRTLTFRIARRLGLMKPRPARE
jgi:ubiquinone/menaquinone biosynthesis C-methylase UbiE